MWSGKESEIVCHKNMYMCPVDIEHPADALDQQVNILSLLWAQMGLMILSSYIDSYFSNFF